MNPMDLDSTALIILGFFAVGNILFFSFFLKILLESVCGVEICVGSSRRGRRRVGRIQAEHQGQLRWGGGGLGETQTGSRISEKRAVRRERTREILKDVTTVRRRAGRLGHFLRSISLNFLSRL